MALLDEVKNALRIKHDKSDSEISRLINSAKADLGIAGVVLPDTIDDICTTAIVAYCKLNFGNMEPADSDKWKKIYDENKSQLVTATGYTDWLEV